MNSKIKSILLMGMAMSVMVEGDTSAGQPIINNIKKKPKKPLPKGCKNYYFKQSGYFVNENPEQYEIVFECVAATDASARRKFEKFRSAEQSNNQSKN